jgi:hypothetical protein
LTSFWQIRLVNPGEIIRFSPRRADMGRELQPALGKIVSVESVLMQE